VPIRAVSPLERLTAFLLSLSAKGNLADELLSMMSPGSYNSLTDHKVAGSLEERFYCHATGRHLLAIQIVVPLGGQLGHGLGRPLDPPSEPLFKVPGSSFHKLRGYKGNFQMANQNEGSQLLWTVESDFLEGEI